MRALLVLVVSTIVCAIFTAHSSSPALAATAAVAVVDDAYVDAVSANSTTTIVVGDTVLWTWSGSNEHTVSTTSAEAFDSGNPATTGTFSHTFNATGTFSYVCGIHGTAMTGSLIVQAGAPPTSTPAPATNTPVPATSTAIPNASATLPATSPTALTTEPAASASVTPAAQTAVAPAATSASGGSPETALPGAGSGSTGGVPSSTMRRLLPFAGLFAIAGAVAISGAWRRRHGGSK